MNVDLSVPSLLLKPTLWFTKFFTDKKVVLVCKGYGDDWEYYTGLCWAEDKYNDLKFYENFRLWIG